MKRIESSSQSGKSLIEVIIILVIIGILSTFAIVRVGQSNTNLERQNIARKLKVLLERSRFDAVKRRPQVTNQMPSVVINSETSFSVALDFDQNGTLATTEVQNVNFGGANNIKIVGNNLIFPITLRFDRRGQVTANNGNGASITPTFIVCNNCTPQTANNANANIISVSATGTVNMIGGGDVLPPFNTPTVLTVDTSSNINDWVTVYEEGTMPTGTPTPIPTATPTGSPTQTTCKKGDRPSQNGCVCILPMTVRSSGRCQ